MKKNEEAPAQEKEKPAVDMYASAFLKSQSLGETLHNVLFDLFSEDGVLWLSVVLAKSAYPAHAQNQLVSSFRSNPRYTISALAPYRVTRVLTR